MEKSKFLRWILALAIVVVLNLFFNYTIDLVYDSPDFNDFCKQEQVVEKVDTEAACLSVGGQWNKNVYPEKVEGGVAQPLGYCDTQFTCRSEYEDAQSVYNRNVFIVLVILGVASIGTSFFFAPFEAVSLGLSLGGVVSLVVASVRYWSDMDEYLRVIVLAIALASLIWFGIKKIKND